MLQLNSGAIFSFEHQRCGKKYYHVARVRLSKSCFFLDFPTLKDLVALLKLVSLYMNQIAQSSSCEPAVQFIASILMTC